MTCCYPDPIVKEVFGMPLTAAINGYGGMNYTAGAVPATTLPTINSSFIIDDNESGVPTLYYVGLPTAQVDLQTSAGLFPAILTAGAELLRIKLFGPRKPPTK